MGDHILQRRIVEAEIRSLESAQRLGVTHRQHEVGLIAHQAGESVCRQGTDTLLTSELFFAACRAAHVEPTRRQARKFSRAEGEAWRIAVKMKRCEQEKAT